MLDQVCGLRVTPVRVRVAADDELVVDAVRGAGFRLAVTSREWLVDGDAAHVRATAAQVASSGVTGARVGPVEVHDPAFLAALRDHYAAVHQWDPPTSWTLDQTADLLLDGAVDAATEAAWRDDGTLAGVSVLHESEDDGDRAVGDVAYCGPSSVDDPTAAADIARLLFARRILATSGVLRVEVDEGDGANGPLVEALAPYPAARDHPDILIYVTP